MMERLKYAVLRVKDGVWLCRKPVVLSWRGGLSVELVPGITYVAGERQQGIDVAAMLDDWLATGRVPLDVTIRVNAAGDQQGRPPKPRSNFRDRSR
jgi:hypothetical protein